MKLQRLFFWLRLLALSNFVLLMGGDLIKEAIGRPLPAWFPLLIFAGFALAFTGPLLTTKVKQFGWLYKLYRHRSPARDGKLVLPPVAPGIFERLYLRVRPPGWCRTSQDDLMIVYRDQQKLMHEGAVALAVLVQANNLLFQKGTANSPASIIYTTDGETDNPVLRLLEIAQKIYALKGTKPEDPDERKFARIVSYEYGRDFRVSVPDSLSHGLDVTYTTIMVHRKHLPFGYLSCGYFPILIHQESRAAMILPARYWPEELITDWTP
jgi:hypothetical protein